MLFNPPKYRKNLKKHLVSVAFKKKLYLVNNSLKFGFMGLRALESGYISPNQLEAIRRIFSRNLKKNAGQVWLCSKPNMPKTKKPAEVRMGKGKGLIKGWYVNIVAGMLLVEVTGLSYSKTVVLLYAASKKLSIKTAIVIHRN
jgi:large subunit ribosomal protein L16